MGVDGGAGNAISLSEIQTFYGGSNPASLSEYYRNGSNVPQTSSASGTSSSTVNSIAAVVTSLGSGYTSFSTTITQGNSGYSGGQSSGNWNVIRENAASGTGTWTARVLNSATTLSVSCDGKALTVTKNGTTVVTLATAVAVGLCPVLRAMSWCGHVLLASVVVARSTDHKAGHGLDLLQFSTQPTPSGGTSGSVTGYTVSLTNNTGVTVNLTSSPWGNDSSFTNGEAKSDTRSANSWSWSHPANTSVPTSGTLNMNTFNAPGIPVG